MSERGYDSDAQYIATPKHLSRAAEASLAAQGFRRVDLSDLIEQSHELGGSEIWTDSRASNVSQDGSAFGLRFIPALKSFRGPRSDPYETGPSSGDKSQSSPSLGAKRINLDSEPKDFAQSLPSLQLVNQSETNPTDVEPFPSIEVPLGINGQNLMADWIQFLRANRQNRRTTSSESLTDQTPGIVVAKKRQAAVPGKLATKAPSQHLDGVGISRMLDARSTSTGILSGGLYAESPQPGRHRFRVSSSQDDTHMRQKSDISAVSGKKALPHRRDASSFYSRQSSAPSAGTSAGVQSLRVSSARVPSKLDVTVETADKTVESQKSKFTEHLSSSPSEVSGRGSSELEPPRKISIGWMSGGRRVGYGYTLVDEGGEQQTPRPKGNASSTQEPPHQPAEKTADEQARGNEEGQEHQKSMEESVEASPHAHVDIDHGRRANPIRETAAAQAKAAPAPVYEESAPISLWSKLRSRASADQNHAAFAAAETRVEDPLKTDTGRAHQEDEHSVTHDFDLTNNPSGTFMRRWARKGRATSIQPRPRKDRDDTHHGRKTWVLGASRPEKEHNTSMLADLAENDNSDHLDANQDAKDTGSLDGPPPSASRSGRWASRFSRHRESKRLSIAHTKESSDASSDGFHDCASLNRTNSTRSRAEEFASMYQDCLETMPGSFEGSARAYRGW